MFDEGQPETLDKGYLRDLCHQRQIDSLGLNIIKPVQGVAEEVNDFEKVKTRKQSHRFWRHSLLTFLSKSYAICTFS